MTEPSTDDRAAIGGGSFAFPQERKEPLVNTAHMRSAMAGFNQVSQHGVAVNENVWREIGKG